MANTEALKRRFEWLPTIIITLCVVALSVFGSMATNSQGEWYRSLAKPEWNPPSWVFAPVWTTIYILLIISATIIWHKTNGVERRKLITLFAINGLFNLLWSFAFFQAESTVLGFVDILLVWITVLMLVIKTWPVSRAASLMLVPYLLWVTFATALNGAIMAMN
ncbi:MAG TPA: TspO/MBR family protein [Candidatus Kapabacteria bacterium]|nr:TspO/MBR family protein [Candidatus Kapabacteria bacterium]